MRARTLWAVLSTVASVASFAPGAPGAPEVSPAAQPAGSEKAPATQVFQIVGSRHAAALLSEGKAHVLDTRPFGKFITGHIPGAVHLEDECLRESVSGLPVKYLESCDLGRIFERAGVTIEKPVLVYSDGEDPLAATMAAYALLKAGHPRVLLLDGGFEAWRGNQPVSQEYAAYSTTPWAGQPAATLEASLEVTRVMSDTDEGQLVDARPAKLFRGEGKVWPRNGHIPTAVNLDWKSLVRADNEALLKPRAEIEKLIKDAGLDSKSDTIVYCGTGREATLLYLYLKGVLEWTRVRLYEGSWTQWSSRPELAVETGDGTETTFTADGPVLIGGQPSADQIRELADRGVTLVINCRTGAEQASAGFSESALAAKLGLKYIEIPLGGNEGYDPADVQALAAALDQHQAGEVLLHCASGGRATQLYTAYLVNSKGLSLEDAQQRLRDLGLIKPTGLERLTGRQTQTKLVD